MASPPRSARSTGAACRAGASERPQETVNHTCGLEELRSQYRSLASRDRCRCAALGSRAHVGET